MNRLFQILTGIGIICGLLLVGSINAFSQQFQSPRITPGDVQRSYPSGSNAFWDAFYKSQREAQERQLRQQQIEEQQQELELQREQFENGQHANELRNYQQQQIREDYSKLDAARQKSNDTNARLEELTNELHDNERNLRLSIANLNGYARKLLRLRSELALATRKMKNPRKPHFKSTQSIVTQKKANKTRLAQEISALQLKVTTEHGVYLKLALEKDTLLERLRGEQSTYEEQMSEVQRISSLIQAQLNSLGISP